MNDGIELAPFYDLLCTEIYPGLKKRFSFSIGGRFEPDKIGFNQFSELERDLGLKAGVFFDSFTDVMSRIEAVYEDLSTEVKKEYKDCKVVVRIQDLIRKRIAGFKKRVKRD